LQLYIRGDDGIRLDRVNMEVTFQEGVTVSNANVRVNTGGATGTVTLKHGTDVEESTETTKSGEIKVSIPGLPVTPAVSAEISRHKRANATRVVEATEIVEGVGALVVGIDHSLELTLNLAKEVERGAGRDGRPIGAAVTMEVRVPTSERGLQADFVCSVEADYYKGRACGHEFIGLPLNAVAVRQSEGCR
jgi:hypothetical protein